ncbi:MAG TPA: class I SAM-dependent methyltransferase [Acetobacteraceae bacterium]|jgi:SAM-dependent methyltransferase|nr:class I SAM-dependent methyltransferase [Acetobacteraceae bacterium]
MGAAPYSRATMLEREAALLQLARQVAETGYRFVTPTPATHGRVNARPGAAWARDLRDVFGWSRPFREGVVPAAILDTMREAGVLAPHAGGSRSLVRFSTLQDLLFVHSAYPTLEADAVFFGPDTYRFARAILAHPRDTVRRAVDIGCGAGPGAILVARAHPEAEVLAVDINDAALRMTRVNATLAGATVRTVRSDLLSGTEGIFDLIVANPPYLVDPAGRRYRHGGGALGAGLSLAILDAAIERLAPGGTLLLYTGAAVVGGEDSFREGSRTRLAGSGLAWTYDEIDPDVFGEELEHGVYTQADRIAAVLLTATKHR